MISRALIICYIQTITIVGDGPKFGVRAAARAECPPYVVRPAMTPAASTVRSFSVITRSAASFATSVPEAQTTKSHENSNPPPTRYRILGTFAYPNMCRFRQCGHIFPCSLHFSHWISAKFLEHPLCLSVPELTEMPTSAPRRPMASFVPSPRNPTTCFNFCTTPKKKKKISTHTKTTTNHYRYRHPTAAASIPCGRGTDLQGGDNGVLLQRSDFGEHGAPRNQSFKLSFVGVCQLSSGDAQVHTQTEVGAHSLGRVEGVASHNLRKIPR